MVEREEQEVMEDLIKLDAKRLKTMEVCTVNATEHTKLYFAAPSLQDTDCRAFLASQTGYQPTFTYPFFGQEELFKGVLRASLQICFHPATFFAFVSLEVDEDSVEMKEEILDQLTEHLPVDGWTSNWDQFIQHSANPDVEIGKIGDAREAFEFNGHNLTIFKCSFENEMFKKLHERVQTLLLFYIEASSYIDDEDTKWTAFMMFRNGEKDGSKELLGYTTLYPFLYYPDKIRLRLSQFLILPAYLRLGLGSQLYSHAYQDILQDDSIKELTVEDPSPEFSAFRLLNDFAVYQKRAPGTTRESLKFSEMQFELLEQLDDYSKHGETKDFRLRIKKSIWRRNKDIMPDDPANLKTVLQDLYDERMELFKQVLKL